MINLLAKDKHILEQPLPVLLKLPNVLIQARLEKFKVAQYEQDKVFSSENTAQAESLRSLLIPIITTKTTTKTTDRMEAEPPSQL